MLTGHRTAPETNLTGGSNRHSHSALERSDLTELPQHDGLFTIPVNGTSLIHYRLRLPAFSLGDQGNNLDAELPTAIPG